MRICFVSKQFDPFITGGIGTYVSLMCGALTAAGHEVHVLTEAHPRLQDLGPSLRPGVRFHAVDPASLELDAYPVAAMRYSMAVHEAIGALHTRFNFDYIEFPEYLAEGYFALRARRTLGALTGAVLAVRLHTPSVMMREHDRQYDMDRDRAYIDHMEAASIAEADLVLSPSRALLEIVGGMPAPGIPANPVQRRAVMRLPHDGGAGAFPPADARTNPTPEVLYFGRVQFLKGPQLIVEAGQKLLESGVPAAFRLIGADTPTGCARNGRVTSSSRAFVRERICLPPSPKLTCASSRRCGRTSRWRRSRRWRWGPASSPVTPEASRR
jgi:glycosyltransferase involved in cell wall biosynthesis